MHNKYGVPPLLKTCGPDVPIMEQHTRLDSRQAENLLLSTIGYPNAA